MELLTDDIRQMMPGPRAQEHVKDPILYVKFFITCSHWTWFAYEGWQVVERAPGFILDMSLGAEPLPNEKVHDIMFFGWVYGVSVSTIIDGVSSVLGVRFVMDTKNPPQ